MRVYLSGPISGQEGYKALFDMAAAALTAEGHTVINPAKLSEVLPDADYEEYMSLDQELLSLSEIICFLPGWQKSLGCQREYGMALAWDKMIIEWEGLNGTSEEA